MSAGLLTTRTPAAVSAAIFSAAVPLPPAMIAPAWPMRRPGGAVCPAMNPTTGFLNDVLMNAAASSSAVPPISPIITTASVSGSPAKSVSASMKRRADQRIAADADAGRLAQPEPGQLVNRFVGQRAALRHDADAAFLADVAGDDAGLRLARRDEARTVRADQPHLRPHGRRISARIMSSVGMPSVMQTASGSPASAASMTASAANGGGTKITDALAPVSRTASATVLNTGQPSCVVPPLPGRHAADDRACRRPRPAWRGRCPRVR